MSAVLPTNEVGLHVATDCPRTANAQDVSWARHGNGNNYMRMIEAYAFASRLERELAATAGMSRRLDALLHRMRNERYAPTYQDLLAVRGEL